MSKVDSDAKAIGIDLGGTHIKGVLIDCRSGKVIHSETVGTRDGLSESWRDGVWKIFQEMKLRSVGSVVGIGLAAPGLAAPDNRSIIKMPGRLAGLEGFDWSGFLGQPVTVLNDAHAALVAEVKYGSAKGLDNVVMLTLGTGVGGALWLNAKIYQGQFGRAGHLGHISIHAGSRDLDITQMPGSLEDAIGNASLPRRTFGQYADTQQLIKAYRESEPVATWAWLNSIRDLATAIASFINVFSPDAVVIGGGIALADEDLFKPLASFLDIFEWRPTGTKTPVVKAAFDEWSGAIGAAAGIMLNEGAAQK